jgi:hypothetical protein
MLIRRRLFRVEVVMAIGSVSAGNVLAAGVQGVQKGLASANDAAGKIARFGTTERDGAVRDGDLATPIVQLKSSELQVKASAAVIKTADETVGTLIDIKA